MIYKEERADLFKVPMDYYLAHCISADLVMGKGIALQFNKIFNMKKKLLNFYPNGFRDQKGHYYSSGCILEGRVFNLITKQRYFEKPTYKTMEEALVYMRTLCQENKVKKLAMPMIGCGLDNLNWADVSESIRMIFEDMDIEILVCHA